MEPLKEAITVRSARLNNQVLGRSVTTPSALSRSLAREGLFDALVVLYDECNTEALKKSDKNIALFVDKYRSILSELRQLRVNIADFEVKNVIGRGHFGEVHVVREKQTGDVYAMKTLRKADTLGKQAVTFYEEERDIMAFSQSHWLTSLQYAFQDSAHLYLIMEFHPGGDLLGLLERRGNGHGLGEGPTRFYLAELTLAIHALHTMGYVHRDIKPDNVLIDRCGHLKLADFGSASTLNASGSVVSALPVGTPEYVAPEVLQALENPTTAKYGISCDYWSLGVVAYELIVGHTPFTSEALSTTYSKIMNVTELTYPEQVEVSASCKHLIAGLVTEPKTRLRHTMIIEHEFFKDVSWNSLREQVPPFVPIVNGCDDTSNFEEFDPKPSKPCVDNFITKTQFTGRNLPFIGFTYTLDVGGNEFLSANSKLYESLSANIGKNLEKSQAAQSNKERKTIEGLQQRLFKAERHSQDAEALERRLAEKMKRVESVEGLRDRLERELAATKNENKSLKRMLDMERKERKTFEGQALELIASTKAKWEASGNNRIAELNQNIQTLEKRIQDLDGANGELAQRLERVQVDLKEKVKELEQLREMQTTYKHSVAKAHERSRQSMFGAESRLEKINSENKQKLTALQEMYDVEKSKRQEAERKVSILELTEKTLIDEIKETRQHTVEMEDMIKKLTIEVTQLHPVQTRLEDAMKMLKDLQDKQSDCKIKDLEDMLKKERTKVSNLQKQISDLRGELGDSLQTLSAHEANAQSNDGDRQALVSSLQGEIKSLTAEKITMQKHLQEALESDQLNQSKVANLEQLLARLEQGVARLENQESPEKRQSPQRTAFLQEQITHLEEQLKLATEQAVLEKQKSRQANSALWKKEKELSDCDLDKRIALRELKQAEEKLKTALSDKQKLAEKLVSEKENHDRLLSEHISANDTLTKEIDKLKTEIEKVQVRAEMFQKKFDAENSSINKYISEANDARNQVKLLNAEIRDLERKVKYLEGDNSTLKNELQIVNMEKQKIMKECNEKKTELENLKMNHSLLKEACSMMEHQLDDLENMYDGHQSRVDNLQAQITSLQKAIETANEETRQAKRATNEEKSFRLLAEKKSERLQNELGECKEELATVKMQMVEYKNISVELSAQLSSAEQKIGTLELELKNEERRVERALADSIVVKEEASSYLTQMHTAREEASRLREEVQDLKDTCDSLREHIIALEDSLSEQRAFYQHREVKSEATLQQQSKLIDFLQSKMDENSKRKKTLGDKLFGTSKKENTPPTVLPLNYRELEASLSRERAKNRTLSEQLLEAKAELLGLKGEKLTNVCESEGLPSPRTKMAMKELVISPSSQKTEFLRQPSKQRMHHNIPHRFEHKLCKKSSKCAACGEHLQFGRQISVCLECNAAVHHKCCHLLPTTCGLPGGFARHFSENYKTEGRDTPDKKRDEVRVIPDKKCEEIKENKSDQIKMEGWVKLPKHGKSSWEKKYLRLEGSCLLIYPHEPYDGMEPSSTLELRPSEGTAMVTADVSHSEANNTARSDIPFILKIDVSSSTTCWPDTSLLIMTLSVKDKQKWLQALNACVGPQSESAGRRYAGTCLLRLQEHGRCLDINCAVEVDEQTILIGAEEGLYSYQLGKSPVHIVGLTKVHQITFAYSVNLALFIAGEERRLVKCALRQLESLSHCASCVEPNLKAQMLVFPGDNRECCHLFQVSDKGDPTLCAATTTQLVIFRYDTTRATFNPVRVLDTSEPVSCVLFTPHSILVSANKFFEIDLQDFSAEEFLDPSDISLSHAIFAHKRRSFPIAILAITSHEYLLCFNEFGLFVDQYGRRTRGLDVTWTHLPISFTYRKPFLFVMHLSNVEVIKLEDKSFCGDPNDSVAANTHWPEMTFVDLANPRYLGTAKSRGAIYVLNAPPSGPEIIKLQGHLVIKDELGASCDTLDSIESENNLNTAPSAPDGPIYAEINKMRKSSSILRNSDKGDQIEHVDKVSVNVYSPPSNSRSVVTSTDIDSADAASDNQSEFSFTSSLVNELETVNNGGSNSLSEESTVELADPDTPRKVRFGHAHHQSDV